MPPLLPPILPLVLPPILPVLSQPHNEAPGFYAPLFRFPQFYYKLFERNRGNKQEKSTSTSTEAGLEGFRFFPSFIGHKLTVTKLGNLVKIMKFLRLEKRRKNKKVR